MKIIPTFFLNIVFLSIAICQSPKDNTFSIREDSVLIETSNGKIFGLYYTPIGVDAKEIPAVLCLQGGGGVGLANYVYEAKFFAKHGIAALICDKSGTGLSETIKSWRAQSFLEKTNEYFELYEWLSIQAGIDCNTIGIHGMSEGGRLA